MKAHTLCPGTSFTPAPPHFALMHYGELCDAKSGKPFRTDDYQPLLFRLSSKASTNTDFQCTAVAIYKTVEFRYRVSGPDVNLGPRHRPGGPLRSLSCTQMSSNITNLCLSILVLLATPIRTPIRTERASNHRPSSPRTLVRGENASSVQGVQDCQGHPPFQFQLDGQPSYAAKSIVAGRQLT
jgi:hypothetical protein